MKTNFPVIDALLLTPNEGRGGEIGICTNTTASGQVLNEIDNKYRKQVSVLGSLIVSRDGTERMIINSLAHPTVRYLILFSEESITFSPSTNLLQAIQKGFEKSVSGNYIKGGIAASAQYPNISEQIFNAFKDSIVVLPVFASKNKDSKKIVDSYLKTLKPKVSKEVYDTLIKINSKKKIYYDSLNELLEKLQKIKHKKKNIPYLNAKDFQHLQPPRIILSESKTKKKVPFKVTAENGLVRLDIAINNKKYYIKAKNEFLLEYSLMKFLEKDKSLLEVEDQILLGAEIGRVGTEIANNISIPSLVQNTNIIGKKEIHLEPSMSLKVDTKYYYKISTKDKKVSCMCMAFDVCDEVFELQSKSIPSIIKKLAELNRFEDYEMDILHRMDIGTQLGRAYVAASKNYSFIQDFSNIFQINTSNLPFVIADGDNFLDVHKSVLQQIYTKGITEEHGDVWKGPARTASVLAIYRDTENALKAMPKLYKQGEDSTKKMRDAYKKQLLRFDSDGSYSYGERTRTFFGFDQLKNTIKVLKADKNKATIVQRFDPTQDMGTYVEKETGITKFTHDPCLTHDIFFIKNNKLHSFHIARAHNTVNAYPENIFGLYDAYTTTIKKSLKVKGGDMFMLSNRANILLLTEEQKTKKILGEPSKPLSHKNDKAIGPYLVGKNVKTPKKSGGVAYEHLQLKKITKRPKNKILDILENLNGVDTVARAITYLKEKGVMHNNTVLSDYVAGESDPQSNALVFFQANIFGDKIHATAVFANRPLSNKTKDIEMCNYITSKHAKELKSKLGTLTLFYIAYK
jgi:thymidylate synthase